MPPVIEVCLHRVITGRPWNEEPHAILQPVYPYNVFRTLKVICSCYISSGGLEADHIPAGYHVVNWRRF